MRAIQFFDGHQAIEEPFCMQDFSDFTSRRSRPTILGSYERDTGGGIMKGRSFGKLACIAVLFCGASGIVSQAQTLTTLFSFNGSNGAGPVALTQGFNGNFYGATVLGGGTGCISGCGTVFEYTPKGLTTLHFFCSAENCADGTQVDSSLYLSPSGNIYGGTFYGGNETSPCESLGGCGTLFEITSAGNFTTIYEFCAQTNCPDGSNPKAPPTIGLNGNLYGTTALGGHVNKGYPDFCAFGCGTIFELTPAGKLTTLHDFCTQILTCPDGQEGDGLTLGTDGYFYGTTPDGVRGNEDTYAGSFYRMTASGKFTVLYQFCQNGTTCSDGYSPSPVVQGADGNFYGTTSGGGGNEGQAQGTFFKITPDGTLTTLYAFCSQQPNCPTGAQPSAVILATDGNFYGTTAIGGNLASTCSSHGCGTIFKITPAGELTTLYTFCSQANCADGSVPTAGLIQGTDGMLYGSTAGGGATSNCSEGSQGCGTLFRLSLGLKPFVESVPNFGKTGTAIKILGNGLTGTTSVTFNGTSATFTVKSNTLIEAEVPSGATSGAIQVTTASGTLNSNVAFQIVP
jgi:uncharacterized repeat protein (TIGR03803 family)